ncbi:uncharacterized protein LOC144002021 isoform X3 [Festucalex cinctus]
MLKDPGGATRYHASEMTKFRARAPSPPPAAGRGINGIPSGSEGGRAHALASGPYDWTSLTTAEAFMQIDEGPILPFLMASSQRRCEWRSAAPSAGTFHPAASQRAAGGSGDVPFASVSTESDVNGGGEEQTHQSGGPRASSASDVSLLESK